MQTDEGDALPEPCEPPPGFAFAALPPTEAALCFTKQSVLSPEADALVGEVGDPLQLECHRLAEGHQSSSGVSTMVASSAPTCSATSTSGTR